MNLAEALPTLDIKSVDDRAPRLRDNMVTSDQIRANYQLATKERRRVPNTRIPPSIRDDLTRWVASEPLRWTKHVKTQMKNYHGKMSRCRSYVEVNDDEAQILTHIERAQVWLDERLSHTDRFEVVELGLNHSNRVCKVGLVLVSPDPSNTLVDARSISTTRDRVLFLCVGMDRGVKTAYITPGYKGRSRYKARDGESTASDVRWRAPLKDKFMDTRKT